MSLLGPFSVCLAAGSAVGSELPEVTSGTIDAAGMKVLGGSIPVKNNFAQLVNHGASSTTWLGMAMRGRYSSQGSGLYQFSSYIERCCPYIDTIKNE